MSSRLRGYWIDLPLLVMTPMIMLCSAVWDLPGTPVLILFSVLLALVSLAYSAERSHLALRDLMPTVVLAALAAAGRVLFAPLPDVKPVSAIAIVAGTTLGPRSGFSVGSLAALVSNAFFGQGPWTPLQMYAWGLVGYLAGMLWRVKAFRHARLIFVYGFLSGLLYGLILNAWHVLGFVRPLSWQAALVAFGSGLPWDIIHGASTVAFLVGIWKPWSCAIRRVVRKFDLRDGGGALLSGSSSEGGAKT